MKSCEKEQLNIIFSDEKSTESQVRRVLNSISHIKNFKINICGLISESLKLDYCSVFTFDLPVEGLRVYHSDRVIPDPNIYTSLRDNPERRFQCKKLDQVNQLLWPLPPKEVEYVDVFVTTDKSKEENTEKSECLYQT